MHSGIGFSIAVVAALTLATGCAAGKKDPGPTFKPRQVNGLTLPARVEGRSVEAATKNGFVRLFWAGINLGSTIPGRQPGEVAATRHDYDRWLSGIGDLRARVIRIYTILRPSFYDALAAYNRAHADRPLFFIQGVWLPGEIELDASGNAYEPSVTSGFKSEIDDAVAVVHGAAKLPQRPGHAGGTYRSNVSRWLLAYSIGIEWDPNAVKSTVGVPSSLGIAHFGPLGRDQGNHSEQQALRMDADMLRDIEDEGYAGGIVFEWIDEWFKFTWNTVDLQLPGDRRQLWLDAMTNEEFFGVVAAEPGSKPAVVLDGKDDEWGENGSQVIAASRGPVGEVRAVKDEEYLYLLLRLDRFESWHEHPITIGLDTRPGGNRGLPNHPGVFPSADVAPVVGPDHAQLFQAAWWEPTRIQYGPLGRGYIKMNPVDLKPGSGAWVHPIQIVNKPYVVPATGEKRPVELHELDNLPIGSGDPSSPEFDSRTLVAAQGKMVEVRLPWALLGYSDPSSLMLYVAHPGGATTTLKGGRVGIAVLGDGSALLRTSGYTWDPWQSVTWHERKKAGFGDLASTMRELSAP